MHVADSFRAARLIRLVNLLLQAVLFLALFGGLNYVALNHTWRFDLTQGRRHSLSPETRSYLERLERNVTIAVTITSDGEDEEVGQAFRDISGILREYAYLTRNTAKKITVEFVDIYKNRKRSEELHLDVPNEVVLISGEDHRRVLTLGDFYRTKDLRREAFQGESTLTAAILDVSSSEKKRIYFLTGHEEMRPDDVDRSRGLSQLGDELRHRNFEVIGLDLSLTHKIPDDANYGLIVIAAPRLRFQPFEVELLRNYLSNRAGRVIALLEPGRVTGLDSLFFDWGIIVSDDLILDPDPRSLTENLDLRLWNFTRDPASHITDNLMDNSLSALVGPSRVIINDVGANDDGLSVRKLISTSPTAWGEKNYRQREAKYTPGQDLFGELGVMVISERLKPANNLPLSVRGGRLAVFGTGDLVTNSRIFAGGNLNLFLATVNWAVDRDTQLNIPPRPIQRFQLALSQEEFMHLRIGLFLGVPGLVALLGIIVYWTRRS